MDTTICNIIWLLKWWAGGRERLYLANLTTNIQTHVIKIPLQKLRFH